MSGEVDLAGVFVTPLLLWLLAALPVAAVLRRLLRRLGVYRLVWHRPLFDVALLVVVIGGLAFLSAGGMRP
jgi:hypothetical protein